MSIEDSVWYENQQAKKLRFKNGILIEHRSINDNEKFPPAYRVYAEQIADKKNLRISPELPKHKNGKKVKYTDINEAYLNSWRPE